MAQLIPTVPGIGASLGTGISKSLNALAEGKIKQMIEGPQNEAFAQLIGSLYPQQGAPGQQPEAQSQGASGGGVSPGKMTPEEAEKLAQKLSPSQQQQFLHLRSEALKQNLEQQKFEESKRQHGETTAIKLIGEDLKGLRSQAQAARKNIGSLNELKELFKSGDLYSGKFQQGLSTVGLQNFFTNPSTELARTLINAQAQGAGAAFNTRRLTNLEVGTYKQALVSLWNTPEGAEAIIENSILENEAVLLRDRKRAELQKERGLYTGLLDDVDEAIEPQLKLLSERAMANAQKALGKIGGQSSGKGAPSAELSAQSSPEGSPTEGSPNQGSTIGNIASGVAKTVGRPVARAVEKGLGQVGDILSTPVNLLNAVAGTPKYEELIENLPFPLGRTSEQFREAGKKVFGESLEPKNNIQQFTDTVIQDAATYLLPGAGQASLFKAITKSIAGEGAAKFTESLGGGPLAQAGVKLGVSLLAGTAGTRNQLAKASKEQYQRAQELAAGKSAPAKDAYKTAQKIFDEVGNIPEAKFVKDQAAAVAEATNKGRKVDLQRLWNLKKDLGQWLEDPKTPEKAEPYIKRLIGSINQSIQDSGHKDFLEHFNIAEDIHTGLRTQSSVSKFLKDHVSLKTLKNPLLWFVAGGPVYHHPQAAAGLAAAGATASEISKTFDLIRNSSTAAKAYTDIFKYSLARDSTNATRAVNRYLKIAEKKS